ncbi:MAG: 50S ribosomal protein L20 [Nitrospirae bacterium]|nr:50S ribosomal protein L20 [Nitrospirota bacterium]
MPRAKGGFKTKQRHNKLLKKAKGYYGGRSKLYRVASEAVDHALQHAYIDRKDRKRVFRRLWIIRINAALRAMDMKYSEFMGYLKKCNVALDRKALADLAYNDLKAFYDIVNIVKAQMAQIERTARTA